MRRFTFSLLLTCSIASLPAQSLIEPGSTLIDYSLLKDQTWSYRMQLLNQKGETKAETHITTHYMADKPGNRFILVQTKDQGPERITDSTIASLNALQPIRMNMYSGTKGLLMDLRFTGPDIHAVRNQGSRHQDTVHRIAVPYFDSNLLDCLLGLIRYEKDSVFALAVYTNERHGKDSYTIRKAGTESITLLSGATAKALHIRVFQEGGTFPNGFDYWIDTTKGLVVKQEIVFGPRGKYLIHLMD